MIFSQLSDKMNIFIFAVIFCVFSVNGSGYTLKDYIKYLARDEPRTTFQRKPVIGSAMIKQYFNDEPLDPTFQHHKPGHLDLENDPDPIIENLPPNQNNFGFIANLNEAQLHELIKEGLKYQEVVNDMIKEKEGIVDVVSEDSEESSEISDNIDENSEETDNIQAIEGEEFEGEHEMGIFLNGNKGEEADDQEADEEIMTTTPKTTRITEKSTSTTEKPTTTEKSTEKDTSPSTEMPTSTPIKPSNSSSSTTTTSTATALSSNTTTEAVTTPTPKPMTTKKFKTKKTTTVLPPKTTTTSKPTTTLNPLINRIIPASSLEEIESLTPDQIDEDIGSEDVDNIYGPDGIADESGDDDDDYEQELIEQFKPKRPSQPPGKQHKIHVKIIKKSQGGKRRKGQRPYKIVISPAKQTYNPPKKPANVVQGVVTCPYECNCGVTTSRRIVGGSNAQRNEFPWVALLSKNGRLTCGGSVINSEYVITAAHCVYQQNRRQFKVKLMQYDRRNDRKSNLITRTISRVSIHPNYNSQRTDKDIALLKLDRPINFSKSEVRPICLPSLGTNFAGTDGMIAGWGTTSEGGDESRILRKAKVPILNNRQCKALGIKGLTSNMLCAGRQQGGVDSCQGDSGGPLMVAQNRRYVLAGIVSFGNGCARPRSPGMYTRTSKFLEWIKKTANTGCFCQ